MFNVLNFKKFHPYTAIMVCVAIVVITLAVYIQVGNHQFLSLDDTQYVTGNPHVTSGISGKNIMWAFTSVEAYNWHPVTWLSHMTDARFFGMNPRGHHLTNAGIHAASSLLLLLLLFRCTGSLWHSFFVAALFALHPLHVESVAWVAERKDVLSAFFWFLTLLFYSQYVQKPKPAAYLFALLSFMLGLMSKPMLVTLPLVMFLMDYWPLDRYRPEEREQWRHRFPGTVPVFIKEKIPFLACSLLSIVITLYAQNKGGAVIGLSAISFRLRAENALVAYVKYIGKTFWPGNLAVYYPFPASLPFRYVASSLVVLLLLSAAAIHFRRRFPFFTTGWFWFLVTLLPVIGLVQVGRQSMADRYSYLPLIGLFIAVAWGVPELTKKLRHRNGILALLAGAVIFASAAVTWQQLGYWRDSISLYQHTLQVTSGNYFIHYNLGVDLAEKGDLDGAILNYRAALRIRPDYAEAHNNLGFVLAGKGDLNAAVREYRMALLINPNDMKAHCNLGDILVKTGNPDAAIREYRSATLIAPDNFDSHNNLGVVFVNTGDLDNAILEYREAIRINPEIADVHNNLGVALTKKGDLDAAIREYHMALRITPDNPDTHNNLEIARAKKRIRDATLR